MSYNFKKGIIFRNGEKLYSYAISEGKMPSFVGGLSLKIEEYEEIEDIIYKLEVSDDLKFLTLSNISQSSFNKIIHRIGGRLIELVINNLTVSSKIFNLEGAVINDFNIFLTMHNLKELILLIGNKKDKVSDLITLSKLTKLKYIELPKNYFFFNQYAWLTIKLPNSK